jgi:putative FmdB family regulatory protein
MAIYELKCAAEHRFEVIQSFGAPLPACPECGAATAKVPSSFGIGGAAKLPPRPEAMPQTWRGTYEGDREYVAGLRRTAEERRRLEDAHPELAGDRRPIIAHEGPFEGAPLRAGEQAVAGHDHGRHGHGHGHPHGAPGHAHSAGPSGSAIRPR